MKHVLLCLSTLLAFILNTTSMQAYSSPDHHPQMVYVDVPIVPSHLSTDTLMLKRKVYYGGNKLKNLKELKTVLETANDAETMRLFKKFQTTITSANVAMVVTLGVVGIPLMVASRGQLKKVIQRFNDVKTGRVKS